MTALEELREAVAAGEATHGDFTSKIFGEYWHDAYCAYLGSLDAAKALHEALLPLVRWQIWQMLDREEYACNLTGVNTAFATLPACAWLLAILDALIQKEEADA